ncbi:hypothetical protein HIM_02891 [Hirsutella minnesotensis 3608]|nr:hypothetical protein HIM_02891 [Hirsutella minnesotensis 3608]
MPSRVESQTAWEGWNTCFVFTSKERELLKISNPTQTADLHDAFDRAAVDQFCASHRLGPDALFKAAWALAIGALSGLDDVCFAFEDSALRQAVHCALRPDRTAATILQDLEEVPLPSNLANEKGVQLSFPFDTTLQIISQREEHGANGFKRKLEKPHDPIQNRSPSIVAQVNTESASIAIVYIENVWTNLQALRACRLLSQCLSEIIYQSDKSLSDLELIHPADYDEIQAWTGKQLVEPSICIHEAIARRAAETPDDIAVRAWDGDLTHQQLETLASRLAGKLYALGVKPGATVAFLFKKSKWTIVSLLAILKAGGTGVALNPEYPTERMRQIINLAEVKLLLVSKDLHAKQDLPGLTELVVDEALFSSSSADSGINHSFSCDSLQPSDAAYIQFTSGSTGTPKGIVMEHRTFLANAFAHLEVIGMRPGDRVLQFASHSFDAFLIEIFMSLLAGACVCVPSEESRMNDLCSVINEFQITWLGITPTMAKILNPSQIPNLKTLCFWGEQASRELIDTWADRVQLINFYGPSENSVGATWHSFSSGSRNTSCIGKGVSAVNTWIVSTDNRDKLVPIGAIGELVLQGPTVARGYLKDANRTAESFRDRLPWLASTTSQGTQRSYFTGDLVRYLTDGSLEFFGRRDNAVKIRGQRIELDEIEHHIKHGEVPCQSVVVMVLEPPHLASEKLVAFICEKEAIPPSSVTVSSPLQSSSLSWREKSASLEAYLKQVLTSAAVPSLYIPLKYLPTVASGKVDRQRLKALFASLSETELAEYFHQGAGRRTATQTDNERSLALLWSQVLDIDHDKICREDNFFWLGGNSILAMRLTAAARESGLIISVSEVLNNPILQDIATLARLGNDNQEMSNGDYSAFSTVSAVLTTDFLQDVVAPGLSIPASDLEDVGLATDYQIENLAWSSLKQRGGTNYVTLDFSNGVDPQRLQGACERLVSHHAILRTVYLIHKHRVFQVVCKRLPFDIVHSIQANDVSRATSAIMETDLAHPLDIGRALIKFWLLQDAGKVQRLVIRGSHLQYDGVALIRWCKELGMAYRNEELRPAPSFLGYTDYAANHDVEGARKFWRKLLSGSSMTTVHNHQSISWKNVLDGEVSTLVDSSILRPCADITVGTIIKSAWALVLSEMAESQDVVFGSVVWGRNAAYPGVEHVAGACIDNIPVRVQLTTGMTRLALLQQVQRQYFEAVQFESFQYKRIVAECTDWKPWERLSTLVEYENLGEDTSQFPFDDDKHFTVDEIRPPADRHDITIYSMPLGEKTFIALDFHKAAVPDAVAQSMLDRMVAHIEAFHGDLHAKLSAMPPPSQLPIIPLEQSQDSAIHHSTTEASGSRVSEDLGEDVLSRHFVEAAWASILACKDGDFQDLWESETPFFEVWGNLIAATGLARWYTRKGLSISMEDILRAPDMRSQVALIQQLHK